MTVQAADLVTARRYPPIALDPRIACTPADNPKFYPPDGVRGRGADREAITICRRCPLQVECLTWALATEQRYGVWGGVSATQRRLLRARMRVFGWTAEQAAVPEYRAARAALTGQEINEETR